MLIASVGVGGLIRNVAATGAPEWADSSKLSHAVRVDPPEPEPACTSIAHIGDSLTHFQVDELRAGYEAAGFVPSLVDGFVARSVNRKLPGDPYTGLTAVDAMKQAGHTGCWVVALGTNDTGLAKWGRPRDAAIDMMMRRIDGTATVPVIWVDTVSRSSAYRDVMLAWNRELDAATARWPNLLIIRWSGWASANPGWFSPDGIHYNSVGSANRVRIIVAETDRLVGDG